MKNKQSLVTLFFFLIIVHSTLWSQAFKEESIQAGINHYFYNVDQLGGGLAFLDFNNDGFIDIYVTGGSHSDKLYENLGDETFTDVSETYGINVLSEVETVGVSAADLDNDGYTDLFVSTASGDRCYVLWNIEGKSFEERGVEGIITEEFFGSSIAVGDYDLDGDLDVYVGNYRSVTRDAFYRNNGDRTFTNVSESLVGEKSKGTAWAVAFSDWDLDNDSDLLIGNDFGNIVQPNRLFQNNYPENTFTEISENVSFNEEMNSMGIAIGDYDEDGDFDYYITDTGSNNFFVNDEGQFNDKALETGVENSDGTSWGTAFVDYNNDSFLDLIVMNGEIGLKDGLLHENKLFKGNGNSFEDVSVIEGVNSGFTSRGMALADYNNDGKMDFAATAISDQSISATHYLLYKNQSSNVPNWIKFELQGTTANRDGYGSLLKIEVGGRTLIKEQTGGGTFLSSHTKTTHFGLGDNKQIDRISITWPGGNETTHDNLNSNLTYRIVEEGELFVVVPRKLSLTQGESAFLEGANQTIAGIYRDTLATTSPRTIRITKLDFNGDDNGNGENGNVDGEHSVARYWNELLLESIRNDYARPTIHARNLFHISMAMYDAFAVYDKEAKPYFLGNKIGGYSVPFEDVSTPSDTNEAQKEAISFACFRLLNHRFKNSPGYNAVKSSYDNLMLDLGYDATFTNTDYSSGNPAALGNYIAEQIIAFGWQDGANEIDDYKNEFYTPKNEPLVVNEAGNPTLTNPNNWQPLSLKNFIDQSGNVIGEDIPSFLSPEWGKVVPFALKEKDLNKYTKEGNEYWVYHDPGGPQGIKTDGTIGFDDPYKWGFTLVSIWSSHLDPSDGKMIDISPASIGNVSIDSYPETFEEYKAFYDLIEGGDSGNGYSINPITKAPYVAQMVPKGDYGRVLAEFWADGPDSETPPGHWFTILNYVSDHPLTEKKFRGKGDVLSNLEWDVKSYLALAGAMHDCAITAWGIKGYYDYIRPISAIRYMAEKGQSSDPSLSNFHPEGIPLIPGYVEIVQNGDLLSGIGNSNAGKIKLYAWKGTHFIENPSTDVAGVDWILAEDWVPYQRPSFVTPPFAGYVSGHSTFSRAAAEVLTRLTGSKFFPGGMGTFDMKKNDFLVFEDGPSTDITLQWATYQDASDQCSLSRIWGGIHPPIDDIAGRIAGNRIGDDAFNLSESIFYEDKDGDGYYSYEDADDTDKNINNSKDGHLQYNMYPVPVVDKITLDSKDYKGKMTASVYNMYGVNVLDKEIKFSYGRSEIELTILVSGTYILICYDEAGKKIINHKFVKQ